MPLATDDQIQKAAALVKRVDLKDFSVCQFSNPGSPFVLDIAKQLKVQKFKYVENRVTHLYIMHKTILCIILKEISTNALCGL